MSDPQTIAQARKYEYGAGSQGRRNYREGFCVKPVWEPGRAIMQYQCQRRIKKGTANDAWCGQHDPDAAKARAEKSAAKYKRHVDALRRPERIRACYERALRHIAELKGVSGRIAAEALAKAKTL